MELDERKLRILKAIIDDYIMTAAPIGSRTISKRADIGFSSATIRNEMSDLEELGLLEQPHTSAGRIPSDKAYRLYVNSIMQETTLSGAEIEQIKGYFSRRMDEVEDVVRQTAHVLSQTTRYTSMVLAPQLHSVRLKHIQLVPVCEGRALAVIVTDAGIIRDSIIRVPFDMKPSQLEHLSHMLTERFYNCRISDIGASLDGGLYSEMGEQREFFDSVLTAVNQRIVGAGSRKVELSGTTNMLNYPEYSDMDKAKSFLSAIETKDFLFKMLSEASKLEFTITIGNENESENMKDCSVVTATYKIGDESIGSMGVIGPTRMDYSKVLAVLGYMGKSLSEMLTNLIEEDRK